jgi:uncharacterized membrane protein
MGDHPSFLWQARWQERETVEIPQDRETVYFQKTRMETLTDGVFAIAMTLLVTGLNIPQLNGIVLSGTVDSILIDLFPDFIHYIIAFGLLASFWWASHMRSQYLRSFSRNMSFLTILTLLFVGLIPFSTNLAGDFPLNTHAVIIFELNLLVLGLLSLVQWNQVLKERRCLNPDSDQKMLLFDRQEAYIFPVLSTCAIVLALMSVPWGILVYLVAPVYLAMIWMKETKIPPAPADNRASFLKKGNRN